MNIVLRSEDVAGLTVRYRKKNLIFRSEDVAGLTVRYREKESCS